jgi:pSer/pThr/pTyr-binding forkhead associated (FHA) protein
LLAVPYTKRPGYQEPGDRTSEGHAAMYLLEVLSGPLDGKTWTFDSEITIGRDDSVAQACLALDRYVSRKHAHVRVDGDGVRLTDLESRNGTKVNGKPVTGDASLEIGVPFMVGRTVLRVTRL